MNHAFRRCQGLLILVTLLLGCRGSFIAPNDSDNINSIESHLQDPSLPFHWDLQSPANGSTSSITRPQIQGTGLNAREGQQVILFKENSCVQPLVTSTIRNGSVLLSFSSLRNTGADDGYIDFYARFNQEPCFPLNIGYRLQTQLKIAGSSAYRLLLNDDAATTAVIGFNASTDRPSDHKIYFGTKDHGQDVSSYTMSAQPKLIKPYLQMNNAFVRLNNLQPNTAYYFVIEDPEGVSPRFWFKTAPATPSEKLSIIAGGDSRNNRTPRKAANTLVSKLRPHAIMFAGDMTGSGTAQEWKEWFEDWQLTIAKDGRMFPLIVARGNHESSNAMLEQLFDTNPSVTYALSLGNNLLRIYTLNSESSVTGDQTTWLTSDLASHTATQWKFAQYHRPMRPHTKGKGEGTSQYKSWAEVFQKYQMNVVSEADSHVVKTTWPIRPSTGQGSAEGFMRDDREGTVYIGEGCWGAPLRTADDNKTWTRSSGSFNQFHWIFVDQNQVEIKVVKVDNASLVDSVSDDDIFKTPKNLNLWTPTEGSTLIIPARKSQAQDNLADLGRGF